MIATAARSGCRSSRHQVQFRRPCHARTLGRSRSPPVPKRRSVTARTDYRRRSSCTVGRGGRGPGTSSVWAYDEDAQPRAVACRRLAGNRAGAQWANAHRSPRTTPGCLRQRRLPRARRRRRTLAFRAVGVTEQRVHARDGLRKRVHHVEIAGTSGSRTSAPPDRRATRALNRSTVPALRAAARCRAWCPHRRSAASRLACSIAVRYNVARQSCFIPRSATGPERSGTATPPCSRAGGTRTVMLALAGVRPWSCDDNPGGRR